MTAVVYDRYGPPEVLRLEQVDRPVPGEGEVLVRVHATTVNRFDTATHVETEQKTGNVVLTVSRPVGKTDISGSYSPEGLGR